MFMMMRQHLPQLRTKHSQHCPSRSLTVITVVNDGGRNCQAENNYFLVYCLYEKCQKFYSQSIEVSI